MRPGRKSREWPRAFVAGRFSQSGVARALASPNSDPEKRTKSMTSKPDQASVPAQLVKALRERTGAGFGDCRDALLKANGDMELAVSVLRKKGQAAAEKKAQRPASEGLIGSYIHAGGKIGVIVEVNCESDFVARTEAFQRLCHDLAMHVAALDPRFVRREEVTPEILECEREIYREQARAAGKPEPVTEKIISGKMEKFFEENCLYEQHFIKDESLTVKELIDQAIATLGENIAVRRFIRFKVGEISDFSAAGAPAAT
jgi:elongation factor Ts